MHPFMRSRDALAWEFTCSSPPCFPDSLVTHEHGKAFMSYNGPQVTHHFFQLPSHCRVSSFLDIFRPRHPRIAFLPSPWPCLLLLSHVHRAPPFFLSSSLLFPRARVWATLHATFGAW